MLRSFGLLCVLALVLLTATGTAAAESRFVRVPASELARLDALGLQPLRALDYGAYRWLEVAGHDLARLDAGGVAYVPMLDAGQVRVPGFAFDPIADGEPMLPLELTGNEEDTRLRLVQLAGPVRAEWLTALAGAGARVLQYYPHHTYLVWAEAASSPALDALAFVRWHGLFHPAYKINSDLAGRGERIENVDVMFYDDGRVDGTLEALKALGGEIKVHYASQPDRAFFNAIVELPSAAVEDVARLREVLWLGYQSPRPILDDEMSDQIVAGNHAGGVPFTGYFAHLAGLGVDGTGVIWSITDSGVDYDHGDLNTRIVGGHNYAGCETANPGDASNDGHGTHVAGIVGADATGGFTDPDGFLYGLGMAPGYSIFAQNPICNTFVSWPPAGGWQELSKQGVLGSAVGANNSWTTGEGTQHGYQASERTHDLMVRDGNFDTGAVAEPYTLVFSAGNSAGAGLTAPKEAKNLIVTASSLNFRAGDIDAVSSFSSRGPAVDGRQVPTITAPGSTIASTRSDNGGSCTTAIGGTNGLYAFCSGTSMAAPHASGSVVLIHEWWRGFNGGADPSPAMAKALLVNHAVDMGTADIWNVNEGWGRIDITSVIDPAQVHAYRDQEVTFDNTGEQWTLTVGVEDPGQPLKVTLAWLDAPGAVGANPALVNNLDLTVVTGGNTYRGNNFAGGTSVPGGAPDTLNNLENVFVQAPGANAVITVDATLIAGDGVPLSGDLTDQDFALVCNNCLDSFIFSDGFESGDTSAWSGSVP